MRIETSETHYQLMKKGYIDRTEDMDAWRNYEDPEVRTELDVMEDGFKCELIRGGDRVYLVPSQDNDLFLKNNQDFRKDISATSEVRIRDIYLMNYLSIYLLYEFYHGEGTDPKCREFISKDDFIKEFTEHCKACVSGAEKAEQTDYSENFLQLANAWLAKTDGAKESTKFNERYGILSRVLNKFNPDHDDLFYVESDHIRPTRRTDALMPYYLSKDRIIEIKNWIEEVKRINAADN